MIIAGFEAAGKGKMSVGGRKEFDESFDAFYPSRHQFTRPKEDDQMSVIVHCFFGASGRQYDYFLPQDRSTIPSVPGNYMFASRRGDEWKVLYVGETENLRDRLVSNRHEKKFAATVYAYPGSFDILYDADQSEEEDRRAAEKDLIDKEDPPLNR